MQESRGHDEHAEAASGLAVAEARRVLKAGINGPTKNLPFHWCPSNVSGREIIDINMIYPLVCAWCEIDVSVAESILTGVFFLQAKDGSIAARYLSDGTPLTDEAPWPLIMQATRKICRRGCSEDFLARVAPRLYRYIDWICYHFERKSKDVPQWRCREESLVPDHCEQDVSSPDLCILIACELEVLLGFEAKYPKSFRQNLSPASINRVEFSSPS